MIPLLLIGAAAFAAGVIVSAFWKQIVSFLKSAYDILPDRVKRLFQGSVTLVRKVGKILKNIIKHYSYNPQEDQWREHIVEKKIEANDVPEHIRNALKKQQEVDVSQEAAEQLALAK